MKVISSEVISVLIGRKSECLSGLVREKGVFFSCCRYDIFIDIQKLCKKEGKGETVLVDVPKRVYETLELAGFTPLFKFFDEDAEAIEYFKNLDS